MACLAVILALALALYNSAFRHGFVQDDYFYVYLASKGYDLYNLLVAQFFSANIYRPVSIGGGYSACYSLFHLYPPGYHVITFSLFLLTAAFVYLLGRELAGSRYVALVAAVFYVSRGALFPEIYWIGCGFSETGTVLFILAGAYAYLAYLKGKNRLLYVSSFALFLLALGSKELGIVFPALLLLLEAWHCRLELRNNLKGIALRVLPFAAVTLAYLYRLWIVRPLMASGPYSMSFTLGTVLKNLIFYAVNSFNNKYEMALLAVFFFAAFAVNRKRSLLYSAWFLACLGPVIFLSVHPATYYLSLPLFGLSMLFASGVEYGFSRIGAYNGFSRIGAYNGFSRIGAYKAPLSVALAAALALTACVSVSFQESGSGIVIQEGRSDRAFAVLRNASAAYPDGSLIYVTNADERFCSALGWGRAISLYYGDNVSTYFEGMEAAPAKDFTGIYYFDYCDGDLYFKGRVSPDG